MIQIDNQTKYDIPTGYIENIASILTKKDIELIICDDDTIQDINREYRQKDIATDVLSFPLDGDIAHIPLGSIIISIDKVNEKSAQLGHLPQDELALLFMHGLLHLLGFDHEIDSGEMREKERELIEQFDLPKSLIIRTEES